jgi:glucose-6-phosphate isomerase
MAIGFDYTNLLADMIGEQNGLTKDEISQAEPQAKVALDGFRTSYAHGLYGFPDLPTQTETVKAILRFTSSVQGTYDTICLVGIGGSALGAWALDCGIRGPHPVQPAFSTSNPRLVILDNVDPSFIGAALDSMNPKKTIVVVAAKSGATAETVAAFLIVRDWLLTRLGRKANERIAVVTSASKGDLKPFATAENYTTFHLPDNVGGRFSVLSAIGLLPAALAGFDVRRILKGAARMNDDCWSDSLDTNLALRSALVHYLLLTTRRKPIQVAFPYANKLWGTAFWFRQLWAESLGKARSRSGAEVHTGQTPIAALGTTDQHSQVQLYMEGPNDKVFTFWAVGRFPDSGRIPKGKTGFEAFDYLAGSSLAKLIDAERRATAAALTENNRPNCTFTIDKVDEEHLGAFMQLLEFQTAYMGELLDINAFDQEGVELGKKYTFALMGRKGQDGYVERFRAYEAKRQKATS